MVESSRPAFLEWTLYWIAYGNRSIYEESPKTSPFYMYVVDYTTFIKKKAEPSNGGFSDTKNCGIHKILLCIIIFYGLPESEPWRPLSVLGQSKTTPVQVRIFLGTLRTCSYYHVLATCTYKYSRSRNITRSL